MAVYHVGASPITGEIYAGTLSKDLQSWKNKTLVTDEAICAVRDHLVNAMTIEHKDWYGYEWTRKDGKKVILSAAIKEASSNEEV